MLIISFSFYITIAVSKKAKKNGDSVKQSKQTIKKLTALQQQQHQQNGVEETKQQLKKAAVLPPSPPSSFGSDSDSDQNQQLLKQSSVTLHTKIGTKSATPSNAQTLLKATRLNSSLRSTQSLLKQMRHQPYALKTVKMNKSALSVDAPASATVAKPMPVNNTTTVVMTSSSNQSIIKEERDNSFDDDNDNDDCWPFLCSLSVSDINL